MEKKKDCGCKAKQDVNKLIKNIEDINKSSSVDFTGGENKTKKNIFNILKIIIYTFGLIIAVIFFIPLLIYIIFSKNRIIKLPRLRYNNNG